MSYFTSPMRHKLGSFQGLPFNISPPTNHLSGQARPSCPATFRARHSKEALNDTPSSNMLFCVPAMILPYAKVRD
jgi:hypothetical protein